jgi:hypothetical protein
LSAKKFSAAPCRQNLGHPSRGLVLARGAAPRNKTEIVQ